MSQQPSFLNPAAAYGAPSLNPAAMPGAARLTPEQQQILQSTLLGQGATPPVPPQDTFENPLGTPESLGKGALAGILTAFGLERFQVPLGKLASKLDDVWGVRHLNDFLEKQQAKLPPGNKLVQFLLKDDLGALDERWFLQQHLQDAAGRFPELAKPLRDQLQKASTVEDFQQVIGKWVRENGYYDKALEKASKGLKATLGLAGELDSPAFLEKVEAEALKLATQDKTLARTAHGLKNLKIRLRGVEQFLEQTAKQNLFLKTLEQQHGKPLRPIGRAVANFTSTLRRIFNGETVGMGVKSTGGLGKLFQVFTVGMAGAFTFGTAFGSASKAKEGDKTKTFFHNLFGIGIGNFVGWEAGKKILYPLMNKLDGSLSRLARAKFFEAGVGKAIAPVAQGALTLLGKRVPFLPFLTVTFGGFAAEILAMFVIGGLFQKAGEKIAHLIFGKPQSVADEAAKRAGLLPVSADPQQKSLRRSGSFQGFALREGGPGSGQRLPDTAAPHFTTSPQEMMRSPVYEASQGLERHMMKQVGKLAKTDNLYYPFGPPGKET